MHIFNQLINFSFNKKKQSFCIKKHIFYPAYFPCIERRLWLPLFHFIIIMIKSDTAHNGMLEYSFFGKLIIVIKQIDYYRIICSTCEWNEKKNIKHEIIIRTWFFNLAVENEKYKAYRSIQNFVRIHRMDVKQTE